MGEADEVAEPDAELEHVRALSRHDLLGGDDLLAQVLAAVQEVHHAEQLRGVGRELPRRGAEAQREVVLRVALLRDRDVRDRPGRRGGVRRRLPEHPRRLDQPVHRQPALDERRQRAGAEQVELPKLRDVRRRQRQAGRAPDGLQAPRARRRSPPRRPPT